VSSRDTLHVPPDQASPIRSASENRNDPPRLDTAQLPLNPDRAIGGSKSREEAEVRGVPPASIRPLRLDDRESLLQILRETQVFTSDEISIALELIDIVGKDSDQRDYVIYVYEDAGSVLGYYCIGPTPGTIGTFDLYWIAVRPSMHGKGIGGCLNDHAEALIRSMEGRLIVAETSSQPRYEKTRKFYTTHGYTELSRIGDYYRVGDDLVVFGKYLM